MDAIAAAASGMQVQQTRQAVSAHNTANATTPEFQAQVAQIATGPAVPLAPGIAIEAGAEVVGIGRDPSPGAPLPEGGAASNVDLAEETVAGLTALRAYQANAGVIRTQQEMDEALAELV